MTKENEFDAAGEARLQRFTERYAKVLGGSSCEFGEGVKWITKEHERPDRALDWYRRFIRSRTDTEEYADAAIESNRAKGFHLMQVDSLRRHFKKWKRLEKSRKARESRKERGKRGRVKSKDDKRLGAKI